MLHDYVFLYKKDDENDIRIAASTIEKPATIMCIFLYSNTGLKGLEKQVLNIVFPESIEKIALKSKIGDSGGNGDYSTLCVVLVVKTEMSLTELKQELEDMNLKFSNYFKKIIIHLFFTLLIVKQVYSNQAGIFQLHLMNYRMLRTMIITIL